ncbi:MAG: dimethyl sulfoxide reductase anchor subunit [Rhizobiaceae bacterium]|nr:dimethyl sulfoxide reductase anchor subunit [Rhizobiaceae bacterium]
MHPAYSVIFFTTATGAGYGLLAALGLSAAAGALPPDFWLGLIGLGLALSLICGGLLSSTGHLGRPERAWRAFSQWRSSWLSREGVLSVATFVPAGLLGVGWVLLGQAGAWIRIAGLASAAGAVATVCATAMIYASLKPVPQWNSRYTLPGYLVLSALSGLVLLNAVLSLFGGSHPSVVLVALVATAAGWAFKLATWRHNDRIVPVVTANSATGLAGGTVRSIEWPHTEENYLLKEMGFRVARKHAARLRLVAQGLAFAAPILLLLLAAASGGAVSMALSLIAPLVQLAGLLVERWLFFAEARHVVTLYYGR